VLPANLRFSCAASVASRVTERVIAQTVLITKEWQKFCIGVLDNHLAEDAGRVVKTMPQNFSLLRHLAVNLLRQETVEEIALKNFQARFLIWPSRGQLKNKVGEVNTSLR